MFRLDNTTAYALLKSGGWIVDNQGLDYALEGISDGSDVTLTENYDTLHRFVQRDSGRDCTQGFDMHMQGGVFFCEKKDGRATLTLHLTKVIGGAPRRVPVMRVISANS